MGVQTGKRSFEDLQIAYTNYYPLWMEFITRCPELVETPWFYEGNGLTEETAIQMRRLIAVWVMLFGTDIVKELVPMVDSEMAVRCHNGIFLDKITSDVDMCSYAYMIVLAQGLYHNREAFLNFINDLRAMQIPGFDDALSRIRT